MAKMLKFWTFYIILTIVLFRVVYTYFASQVRPGGNGWGIVGLFMMLLVWGFGWLAATFVFAIRDIWPHCCGRIKTKIK